MSKNPEIEKARQELEKLHAREKELEERLTQGLNATSANKQRKQRNKQLFTNNNRPQTNSFENFFYRETSGYEDSYNNLAQSIHTKENSAANESDDFSDNEEENLTTGQQQQYSPQTNGSSNASLLIDFRDFENSDEEADSNVTNTQHQLDAEAQEIIYEEDNGIMTVNLSYSDPDVDDHYENESEELHLSNTSSDMPRENCTYNDNLSDNGENEDDIDSDEDDSKNIDRRVDVKRDIEESLARERYLKYERGSRDNLDQLEASDTESEPSTDIPQGDIRNRIMKEIEEEKFRESELHAQYKDCGLEFNNPGYVDSDQASMEVENVDPRDLIALEIDALREREEELRMHQGIERSDRSESPEENESTIQTNFLDPRDRIDHEIRVQQEREVELRQVRKSLSNENLLMIDTDDEEEENVKERVDPRGKIVRDIEETRLREQEFREQHPSHADYDIIELESNADVEPHEVHNTRDKIYQEMAQLQQREEELRKKQNWYHFNETQSFEDISLSTVENQDQAEAIEGQSLKDTHKKKFGSREDLVAFFGAHDNNSTTNEATARASEPREQLSKPLKIPDAFVGNKNQSHNKKVTKKSNFKKTKINGVSKEGIATEYDSRDGEAQQGHSKQQNDTENQILPNGHSSDGDKQDTEPYFHDEMKPVKASKKKLVLRRKNSKGTSVTIVHDVKLVSQDARREEKRNNRQEERRNKQPTRRLNIHPIAAKWEQKGEEERQRQLALEQDLQRKKEEKLKYLAEKAKYERNVKLLKEEEEKERMRKENDRKMLKVKQKGLNELWAQKKPIVTEHDNSDEDDQELLARTTPIPQQGAQLDSFLGKQSYKSFSPKQEAPNKAENTSTSPPKHTQNIEALTRSIAVGKKIKKWEKKIFKGQASNK